MLSLDSVTDRVGYYFGVEKEGVKTSLRVLVTLVLGLSISSA